MIAVRFIRVTSSITFVMAAATVLFACQGAGAQGPLTLEPPEIAQNFAAIASGSTMPPDTNGAVGPNHLLVATNGMVRVQDRAGNILSTVNLLSFWSGLGMVDAFDPRSYFDPYSQRFVMITCGDRRSASSSMLFAVSETDDPTGNWHRWALDADSTNVHWVDYGNLGFTNGEITFTGNLFTVAGDNFGGVRLWRIDRASAMDGGALTMETMNITGAGGTLVPVSTYDAGQTAQYIVRTGTANLFGTGRVQLYRLDGVLGASVLSMLANAALGAPWAMSLPNAPQLGSAATIETNDDRLLSAVLRGNRIWACHTAGMPALGTVRTGAKWWQLNPADGRALQSGVLEDAGAERSFYYPSLVVNSQGVMLMSCSGSSPSEYVGVYYTWRNPDTALGVLEGYQPYYAGTGPFSGPRWGDYSGTYLDPVDETSIWALQQHGEVSNRWGIRWAQFTIKENEVEGLSTGGPAALALLGLALAVLGLAYRFRYIVGKN